MKPQQVLTALAWLGMLASSSYLVYKHLRGEQIPAAMFAVPPSLWGIMVASIRWS